MTYTVTARRLTKSFGSTRVLDGIDLAVERGTVFALLGPNGAGKTTLVRILATLLRPDAGTATVAGHDVGENPLAVRKAISLTGQFAAVDELLTGRENLELMARLRHLPRAAARRRSDELLAEFDLLDAAGRRAATYSGGMKRRLDLAISMIEPPQLLFLDEPTTGLDPRSREQLWTAVRRLTGDGVTVLLTTQYLEEADQLADTVAVLDRGRIVASGRGEELKANAGRDVLRLEYADAVAFAAAARNADALRVDPHLRRLDVATSGSAADVRAQLDRLTAAGDTPVRVSLHRPTLDDVFLALTGGRGETSGRATHSDSREVA